MDKWQAMFSVFDFGYPVYDETSVPKDAPYPRITYEARTGSLDDIVTVSASVWDKSTSWENADFITNELENRITNFECPVIEGGRFRVFKGVPFAQHMKDPESDLIRRTRLQINFEFLTV